MRLSKYIVYLVGIVAILRLPQLSFAYNNATFPSCVNIGARNADIFYPEGRHGIAGDTNTHTGSDSVYKLHDNSQVLQCFCGSNGQGIQTNWIRTDILSDPDIASLEQQGWILIPYGSDWGLDNGAYLAQNTMYSCLGTATVQSATAVNNNSSSSNTNPSAAGNALVQLANTGNSFVLIIAILLGTITMASGIIIYPRKK